jgi:hypothetical protein
MRRSRSPSRADLGWGVVLDSRVLAALLERIPCRLCGRPVGEGAIWPKGTHANTRVCPSCAQDLPIELLAGEDV